MDRRTFLAIERVIRTDMTSEERARIGRVVREVAAGEALGALLGEKVVDLTEMKRDAAHAAAPMGLSSLAVMGMASSASVAGPALVAGARSTL